MTELTRLPAITAREFESMDWVDPKQALINLRWLELNLPEDLDEKVRRLRTNKLKDLREARTGAIFAYGLANKVIGVPVFVAKAESKDFDFVMRWFKDGNQYFVPVQLKELPPDDLNPGVSIDEIYTKLSKYSGANDLLVLIHVNRRITFDYHPWKNTQRPNIRELWYLGCVAPDQSEWMIYGSALETNPSRYDFSYPAGVPNVA
jgi:hypothetical protein